MSALTMFVYRDDDPTPEEIKYPNAWLGAPAIWTYLWEKYVPKRHEYDRWDTKGPKRLFDIGRTPDSPLTEDERILLWMTGDYAYIDKEDFNRVLLAMRNLYKHVQKSMSPNADPTHLRSMCAKLLALSKAPKDICVAFQWTSVSDNLWCEYSEDDDEEHWINPRTDERCWNLIPDLVQNGVLEVV